MHACMDGWMDACMHVCMYVRTPLNIVPPSNLSLLAYLLLIIISVSIWHDFTTLKIKHERWKASKMCNQL